MKHKILIIEDDQMLRESTADLLREEGYTIYQAENGLEGIKKALESTPDLILCDIAMPNFDGYKVYQTLQENTSTSFIPFIYLTAKTEKDDIRAGMQLGADDYITKPFDYKELQAAISTRLEKYQKLLNTNQKNLNTIIENDLVGVYVLKDDKIAFLNNKFSKMLDYSDEEIKGKNFYELIHEEDKNEVHAALEKCKKGIVKKVNVYFRMLKSDGQYTQVETSGGMTEIQREKAFIGMLTIQQNQTDSNSTINPNSLESLNRSIDIILNKKDYIDGEMTERLKSVLGEAPEEKTIENKDNLTKREIEVLRHICKGMTNQQIADNLYLSRRTIDTHRTNLLEKSGSKNTAQLIMYGIKNRIIQVE